MKQPSSLDILKVADLYYPVMLAQSHGMISEAKAAELLGMDIQKYRELQHKIIRSFMTMLESLPSPLSLLLETIKKEKE